MNTDDTPPPTPEWLVTYGDLMSLLLTIFVMLVSMGELKQTDKFQGVADSLHEQFGYNLPAGLEPGDLRPRNSMLASLALAVRAQRRVALARDHLPQSAVNGPVRLIRPGDQTTVGTAIHFAAGSVELSEQGQAELRQVANLLAGKPHKIEIRGHATPPSTADADGSDAWELAYQRARATMRFLIDDLRIDEARIRLSTAGAQEPVRLGPEAPSAAASSRVEVFLLEEVAQ
jgi:chemotaxis protein MotB